MFLKIIRKFSLKVPFSRKEFDFWPENFHLPILQQFFCPEVEIFIEIWNLAHFFKVAQVKKCAKIQIPMEISTPGQRVCCWMEDKIFSGQKVKSLREKAIFIFDQPCIQANIFLTWIYKDLLLFFFLLYVLHYIPFLILL